MSHSSGLLRAALLFAATSTAPACGDNESEPGATGEKGEKGDQGATGEQGERGEQGPPGPAGGTTADYANTIADIDVAWAFSEVCFLADSGTITSDSHPTGGASAGGSCEPGDPGWIIEQVRRDASNTRWVDAKADCLADGWRLPEVFEWQYSCYHNDDLGLDLDDATIGREWISNHPANKENYIVAAAGGSSGCDVIDVAGITSNLYPSQAGYRCVR